ncbi:MAG TPA: NAD(P)/FAD-dependent oxidoreductase [Caulobacteraceae bacterium]|jgi:phytoene dehydrogenase-like protein|nr:NAD(P)/FAD-dependent oxidoreductase [Caulobacteraceae bacterium]
MPAAFDAIVIGAGQNGLALALRLQRAGLKTLVVEAAPTVGGMARSEAAPAPGFLHNPHANYLAYGAISPIEREFDLAGEGLVTVTPSAQHGLAFADGRPPLILHRRDLIDRSVASLAAFSKSDAEVWRGLSTCVKELDPLMGASLYAPASRAMGERQIDAAGRVFGRAVGQLSARAVIDSLFAADEVRTLFYQLAAETGLLPEAPGSAVGFLTFTLWLVGQWRLPVGGMQAYAEALSAAARREGVEILLRARVDRILMSGDRAIGVKVGGHGRILARRAVASSAGLASTLLHFLPQSVLSAADRAAAQAYAAQDGPSLGVLAVALAERPRYRSARWDPQIDRCFRTVIGYEDSAATLAHLREIEAGLLPPPSAALRINSLWDGAQAPAGCHVAGGDVLMPGPSALDAPSWRAVGEAFLPAFFDLWSRYAPNITADTVIAASFEPPQTYDRFIQLREGTDQYRTGVRGLYLCGASTFPGGGVHGACGHNAFDAMAEDLALGIS